MHIWYNLHNMKYTLYIYVIFIRYSLMILLLYALYKVSISLRKRNLSYKKSIRTILDILFIINFPNIHISSNACKRFPRKFALFPGRPVNMKNYET